jgi:hypothetical protein
MCYGGIWDTAIKTDPSMTIEWLRKTTKNSVKADGASLNFYRFYFLNAVD